MIQPNEIRLNNWVQTQKGTYKQIKDICEDGSVWLRCNLCVKAKYRHELEGLHPIPLTEDVLLKCGFGYESAVSSFTHPLMDMWLSLDYDSEEFIMYPTNEQRKERQERLMNKFRNGEGLIPTAEAEYKMSDIRIIYLHQLQNLYFALTNQELEIEL